MPDQPLEEYDVTDLGAPFDVTLIRSVRRTDGPAGHAHVFPDLPGLMKAVAIARMHHSRALSGRDISYLYRVTGLERTRIAAELGIDVATMEAYEAGSRPIPGAVDKLVRIHAMNEIRHADADGFKRMIELMDWVFETYRHVPLHLVGERVSFRLEYDAASGWTTSEQPVADAVP